MRLSQERKKKREKKKREKKKREKKKREKKKRERRSKRKEFEMMLELERRFLRVGGGGGGRGREFSSLPLSLSSPFSSVSSLRGSSCRIRHSAVVCSNRKVGARALQCRIRTEEEAIRNSATVWSSENATGGNVDSQTQTFPLEKSAVAKSQPSSPAVTVAWRRGLRVLVICCLTLAISLGLNATLAPFTHAGQEGAAAAAGSAEGKTLVGKLLSFCLHLDKHLSAIIVKFGEGKTYAFLTAIVFCETGLVVTPFLPGDSLLFACGAFCALGSLKLEVVITALCMAAIAGDAVNYLVGHWVGKKVLSSGIISEKHVKKTEKFYEKYGGKTVVMARFVPIVRTFAPFVVS